MTYVLVRANMENRGVTPLDILHLDNWNAVVNRNRSVTLLWDVVAETDTLEEAEALVRLLPKRNEEWINDKK